MAETNRERQSERLPARYGSIEVPPCPPANQPPYTPELERFPDFDDYVLPRLEAEITGIVSAVAGDRLKLGRPPKHIGSDYTLPLFKQRQQIPVETLVERLVSEAAVESAEIAGPYLNLKLDRQTVGASIVETVESMAGDYGLYDRGHGQTVVMDTSSPNIAKEMTIAHLRSTVIGEALGRLYQNCGYSVVRDNHLGDWGTQFGILGRAHELWGHEVPELQPGGEPIKGLLELYVRMNQAITEEAAGQGTSDLRTQGLEWFRRLEAGDPQARELWQWAKDISWTEANALYQRLGSNFEYILGESEYVGMLPSLIAATKAAGIARVDDKGRTVIKFGAHNKLGDLAVLKSDDTSLYATRDLACLAARNLWFDPAKIIYVVGGEQSHYFEQVFHAFKLYSRLADATPAAMEHVSFGIVKLPEGKMSTREGNVIFLEDVLDEAVKRARQIVDAHNQETGNQLAPEEVCDIAEKVGVGAVIYSELRQPRGRKIEFDWDEMLSFTGNSGPYLQYTNARINAIFRKLEKNYSVDYDAPIKLGDETEQDLAMTLGRFPQAIDQAVAKNEPSVVAEYLHELCSAYNSFYKTNPVINAPDKVTKDSRLRLSHATATVLRRGMQLLSLPIPERM